MSISRVAYIAHLRRANLLLDNWTTLTSENSHSPVCSQPISCAVVVKSPLFPRIPIERQ